MSRRRFLVAAAGLGGLLLSGCSIIGNSQGSSAAMAQRLRTWLEGDPRVADIAKVTGQNMEGDVRAQAEVTLVSPLTGGLVTEFAAAFLAAVGSDHWSVAVKHAIAFGIDSASKAALKPHDLGIVWAGVHDAEAVASGRVITNGGRLSFDVTVTDDPVAHGLGFVGADWVALLEGFSVGEQRGRRSCHYSAGGVTPGDLERLKRLATSYPGAMELTMTGTEKGAILLGPAEADRPALERLVASLDLPPSFRVTYEPQLPSPAASTT